MATEQAIVVHPGDVVQDHDGLIYLAAETHNWGVGAVMRWREGAEVRESYTRLRGGDFANVGRARLLPEEVAQRRRDSMALAREIARENGTVMLLEPVEVIRDLLAAIDADADAVERSRERAQAWMKERGL